MRFFQFILLLLVLYGVVRLIVALTSGGLGGRYRAYRTLATNYRGRYESRGLVDPPTVSFTHGGSAVRVGLAPVVPGQSNPPRTRIVTRFGEGLPYRLELFPALRPAPAQMARGTRTVRTGDHAFDRDFIARANDPDVTLSLTRDPAVRLVLDHLRKLAPPAGILVAVNPERMLVQVDRDLGATKTGLELAVGLALRLHDRLIDHVASRAAEGIDIVESGSAAPEDAGPATCKVCGESIEGEHVVCTTCRTPHHGDCWSFVGGCSIYGCKGKQSVPTPAVTPSPRS